MPTSVVGWTRLEPITRGQGLDGGLRAEVHDPLWMLARQWQLGEFWGSDGGTPVQAALRMDCTPVTRYLAGNLPDSWFPNPTGTPAPTPVAVGSQFRSVVPLETLVEREPVRKDSATRPALAAEAGLHLLRLLDPTGSAGYRAALLTRLPLQAASATVPADLDAQHFLSVMGTRAPDCTLIAWAVRVSRSAAAIN